MAFGNYTRVRGLVDKLLVARGDQQIAAAPLSIFIPYNYLTSRLADIGEKINILAVGAVVSGGQYGLLNGSCKLTITPSISKQKIIDGIEYLEFQFAKGDIVIPSSLSVKDSDLIADMYRYFITGGRIPTFFDYDDIGNLFIMHKEYGGLNISSDNVPFEIVASMITRTNDDKFEYYRLSDMSKPPSIIPFKSVLYNAPTTTAKLLGSNLTDGFVSALVHPSDQPDELENMLRR